MSKIYINKGCKFEFKVYVILFCYQINSNNSQKDTHAFLQKDTNSSDFNCNAKQLMTVKEFICGGISFDGMSLIS